MLKGTIMLHLIPVRRTTLSCRQVPDIRRTHPAFFTDGTPVVKPKRRTPRRDARGRFVKAA